jgi:hypothetical protein
MPTVSPRVLPLAAAFALLAAGAACAGRDAGADGKTEQEPNDVVRGRASTEYPAVGYLLRSADVICTATLIAPDVVLTAAHCTSGHTDVSFGWGDAKSGQRIAARTVANHPRYRPPRVGGGLGAQSFDIALVALTARPPLEPLARAASPNAGATVLGLGYGSNVYAPDDAGVPRASGAGEERKSVTGQVLSRNPTEVFVRFDGSGALCYGDSGGPLLVDGKVAGTLSRFASTPSCRPESRAIMAFTRLDATASFFDAADACFGAEDIDACLSAPARGLCAPVSTRGATAQAVVRPTTGDARDGSFTFELGEGATRALRLPAFASRTRVSVFSSHDARATLTRGARALAENTVDAIVDAGDPIDVGVATCSGITQSVTLVWAPAE